MSGGHGERWEALLGSLDGLMDRLRRMAPEAEVLQESTAQTRWRRLHPGAPQHYILAWPKARMRMAMVVRRDSDGQASQMISAFPLMEAAGTSRLELLEITSDEKHGEAELVVMTSEGRELALFDPLYVLHREDLVVGRQYAMALSGLAYSIRKAARSFKVDGGPMLDDERRRVAAREPHADVSAILSVDVSAERMRFLNRHEESESDAEFFMKAADVEWFAMDDLSVCRMVGLASHGENGRPIRLVVYASEHVLNGYRPKCGDLLNGVAWLQGVPLHRLRQTQSWVDCVLPGSPAEFQRDMERGDKAAAKFPGAHPGVVAFIGSLGQTGWMIEPQAGEDAVGYGRCLSMRQDDREIRVWVRAFLEGQEPDCTFTPAGIVRLSSVGLTCAFVTVRCEDIGTHWRLSYTGYEPIEAQTGVLSRCTHIAKPEVLSTGD